MFGDRHSKGLILTDADKGRRFGRPTGGLGPLFVVIVVLLVSAMNAGLLALVR